MNFKNNEKKKKTRVDSILNISKKIETPAETRDKTNQENEQR